MKSVAIILTTFEFPLQLIVRKSEHRPLSLKPPLPRRTSQEVVVSARSPLTAFWSSNRRFTSIGEHTESLITDLLTRLLNDSCVFPLRHVASPLRPFYLLFPYRGIIEKRSILWLKHQDLFNDPSPVQLSPSNYSLLRLESRLSFVVSSIPFASIPSSLGDACWRLDDKRMPKGTRGKGKQDFEREIT